SFYPFGDDGSFHEIGKGDGIGYNINVPWEVTENATIGDADYLAAWEHILLPVAKEFSPEIILVSAGFDAAAGDPLGGCGVTPTGFSVMLKKLIDLAKGRIVILLEGGYNLRATAESMRACVEVLLEEDKAHLTWSVIKAVRQKLSPYWSALAEEIEVKMSADEGALAEEIEVKMSADEGAGVDNSLLKLGRALLKDVILMASKTAATHSDVTEIKLLLKQI
ncbi:putative histone deacetylase hda1, partial [Trifolium medium]|nr:putative histone deacetylase hda1 [Trifolium medium]